MMAALNERGRDAPGMVTVRIPAQIRRLYGAQAWEQVAAGCVADVIAELERRYPGMGDRLTEPGGALRRWVNVFVNGEDVRDLAGPATPLPPGVEVQIVPSVAGGRVRQSSAELPGSSETPRKLKSVSLQ